MKLDQPASQRRSLFGEEDAVLQSHPLLESARHPDAVVPRFGDTVGWDFNGIVRRPANLSPAEWADPVLLDGAEMTTAFIAFINAARDWTGLEEIPAGTARPHMFRRTMAMLTDQFPGSEIALGIQLKHAATRALANHVTQGYAASDPSWSKHLESAIDAARFRRIKDLYQAHKNGYPVGFGPGAAQISKTFDEIQDSVTARGGDARVEESLLRKARITIRFGTLNHCLFDPSNPVGAVCLEHATIPAGHTGPLEERCRPDRCRNSLIGTEHVAIHDAHRRTHLALLQTPNLPSCRQALIRRELERVEAVLDTIPKEPR